MSGREIKENTIRTFQQANIKFAYEKVNSAQENVLVTITSNVKNCNLEYTLSNPENNESWQKYTGGKIEIGEDEVIYARLVTDTNEVREYATGQV